MSTVMSEPLAQYSQIDFAIYQHAIWVLKVVVLMATHADWDSGNPFEPNEGQ